jgi:hypothetical protein
MKKYRVSLCFQRWDDVLVDAEDEADALEKGRKQFEEYGALQGEDHCCPDQDFARLED